MKKLLTILVVLFLFFSASGQEAKKQRPLQLVHFNDNVKLPLTVNERSQIDEVYGNSAEKFVLDSNDP